VIAIAALAGCAIWQPAEPLFVAPASFTDKVCGRYASERGQDVAMMGQPSAMQVRVAGDTYNNCMRDRIRVAPP
jgi:hypothetical protein